MGIFSSTKNIYEDDFISCEGYNPEFMPMYGIFMECADDELAIMEAIHAYDMAEIEGYRKITSLREASVDPENDEDVKDAEEELEETLEAASEGILTKIINALKAFWEKIKNFFKGIADAIKANFGDNEAFIKRYGDKIRTAKFKSFTMKGYNYNIDALKSNNASKSTKELMTPSMDAAELIDILKGIKTFEELGKYERDNSNTDEEMTISTISGIIGKNTTSETLNNDLFDYFYGKGASKNGKSDITVSSVGAYLAYLGEYKDVIKTIDSRRREIDAMYSTAIASLTKLKGLLKDPDDKVASAKIKYVNKLIRVINAGSRATMRFLNTWTGAAKSYASFCRSACMKAINNKDGEQSTALVPYEG